MLSCAKFICQSIELHLFFARIMKEHAFFLEAGFIQKNSDLIKQAECFRRDFDRLLAEVVSLAKGIVSSNVLESHEIITPYTLPAEIASSYFTGIKIPVLLTKVTAKLDSGCFKEENQALAQKVYTLNNLAINITSALIKFKCTVLESILCCKIFTTNYPLLIDHFIREADLYLQTLKKIQSKKLHGSQKEIFEQELFWNTAMSEHAKFTGGLLDPSESKLIEMSHDFNIEFDRLVAEAEKTQETKISVAQLTKESFRATKRIRYFKAKGTEGLLECKIKSTILPLLADHTLREANHYLRLLKKFRE